MPNNEWGDFQTPPELARRVVAMFRDRSWRRVLEPTCGTGSFLHAAGALGADEYLGIEVNEAYAAEVRQSGARVLGASVFGLDLGKDLPWAGGGPLLVIGNPPWVTSADLAGFGSMNIPEKVNHRGLKGLDALTGASNFDIAEYIWLKLIVELLAEEPVIALLCKTHVARNVLTYCHQFGIPIRRAELWRFDAKQSFGVSVDACVFVVEVGGSAPVSTCAVYSSLEAKTPERHLGFEHGELVADVDAYRGAAFADGACPFEWRQGVKHDAARVMELKVADGKFVNGLGEVVNVEPEWVYPLLKSTDVYRGRPPDGRRVIVTQRSLREEPEMLAGTAPRLWAYLQTHAEVLDRRRSSIYRNRPRFSLFGIGEYTFAPWKVMVSGFHKTPAFRVVGPHDGKPVLSDDTTYFLAFDRAQDACLVGAALRSEPALDLLRALTFPGAKRPVTKKVLRRIDVRALVEAMPVHSLLAAAEELAAPQGPLPNAADLEGFLESSAPKPTDS